MVESGMLVKIKPTYISPSNDFKVYVQLSSIF